MTLREAEKAVLAAAVALATEPGRVHAERTLRSMELEDRLVSAATIYRHLKAAGKPRVKCFCGKTVSVEGDHLRTHLTADGKFCQPMLTDSRLPTAQPRGGGQKER